MGRLTIRNKGYIEIIGCKSLWPSKNGRRAHLQNAIIRLAEYDDAEEQGLLLWLPCKPGDTVYEIVHPGCRDCAVIDHERYKSCHVQYGEFCGKEEIRAIPFSPGCLDYMGGLVFLTHEEAERAIKEGSSNACMDKRQG